MNQTSYQFGQFTFCVNSNTLVNHQKENDAGVILDPKVAALLLYFLQHPQRVISKSELLENVWPESNATKNIITWALSKLRKALADDPFSPNYVQTIPRQGFLFIPAVEQDFNSPATSKSNRTYWRWIIAISIIALGVMSFQLFQINVGRASIGSIKNITALDGIEIDPELSPNRNWLLFRHKAAAGESLYQLNITPWDGETTKNIAIQVTDNNHEYISAVWGKTENIIYTARIEQDSGQCEIVQLELNKLSSHVIQAKKLLDCHEDGYTKLAFDGNDSLYFNDKTTSGNGYSTFQLSLTSFELNNITSPVDLGLGDYFLTPSLNKHKLLIARKKLDLSTEIIIYDIADQKGTYVANITSKVHSVHLSPDNKDIWLSIHDNTVVAHKIEDNSQRKILVDSVKAPSNLKAVSNDLLMYTEKTTGTERNQKDIKSIKVTEL